MTSGLAINAAAFKNPESTPAETCSHIADIFFALKLVQVHYYENRAQKSKTKSHVVAPLETVRDITWPSQEMSSPNQIGSWHSQL